MIRGKLESVWEISSLGCVYWICSGYV